MRSYTVNITYEDADNIIISALKEDISQWEADLAKERPLVFEHDPVLDKKIIRKHIKAAKRIIKYYSVSE